MVIRSDVGAVSFTYDDLSVLFSNSTAGQIGCKNRFEQLLPIFQVVCLRDTRDHYFMDMILVCHRVLFLYWEESIS